MRIRAALLGALLLAMPASAQNPPLGFYTGYGQLIPQQLADATNFQLGSTLGVDFAADQGTWTNYEGSVSYWACQVEQPRTQRHTWAIGFFPAGAGATLQLAAQGAYDQHYVNVATTLKNCGYADSIIRVAWEFNCDCYPWSIQRATGYANEQAYANDYKSAFQHLVNAFRSVNPNPPADFYAGGAVPGITNNGAFTYVWNPNCDYYNWQHYQLSYPGNYWTNIVAADCYDHTGDYGSTTDPVAWFGAHVQFFMDGLIGFNNNLTYNGYCCFPRGIALPEWAAGGAAIGDNPYFINQMANLYLPSFSFTSWWNGGSGSGYTGDLSLYPKEKGALAARFGGVGQ